MRYVMHIKYDGHSVNGFARQLHKNTIEDKLNESLSMLLNEEIKITGSARTDSKVHALDQVVMFDTVKEINIIDFKHSFNRVIPSYIYCTKMYTKSDDFHVRYDMDSKTYRYIITTEYDPFLRMYAYHHINKIDTDLVKSELKQIEGKHNFKSFCASNSSIKDDFVRTVNFTNIYEKDKKIIIEINANGFLYNMVRIIIGTLIDINDKKVTLSMAEIIKRENRIDAGKTAPAQGLYLYESIYKK